MNIFVTGGSGYIGRALLCELAKRDHVSLRTSVRRQNVDRLAGVDYFEIADIEKVQDLEEILRRSDVVIHTAARVHQMATTGSDELRECRRVNVLGSINLARQAANAGIKRFVFLSTVKVHGEYSEPGRAFSIHDRPAPMSPYAVSKYEAEIALRALADESGMDVVVVRLPLVYGPYVKANFRSMMQWVNSGIPLPLAGLDNRRSLLALDNLVDLLWRCSCYTAAANQTFLAADGQDLSTPELLRGIGHALGKPARLFRAPKTMLRIAATLIGKSGDVDRLMSSLQVDVAQTFTTLKWSPPISVEAALEKTARNFLGADR